MKAIVMREFGGPDVLKIEDVPDPKPGAGQVVVRNYAIGVNPVDTYIRAGQYTTLPSLPATPGQDSAGEIEQVGEGVTEFKLGERAYIWGNISGSYAEKTLCEAWQAHPLPEHVSFEQGAAVGTPGGAAWRALFVRGEVKAGETVLIHGATGTVGISAVQMARAAGLIVIGTAGNDQGKQDALAAGAHFAFGHDDWEQIKACIPEGKGPEVILEMLANKNLASDLKNLAPRGRVVVIGSRGPIEIDPRAMLAPELDIRGMSISKISREESVAMGKGLVAALEARVLVPQVGPQFPLADASKAHEAVVSGKTQGKITLKP